MSLSLSSLDVDSRSTPTSPTSSFLSLNTLTSHARSSSSNLHSINIARPCPLLDVIPPVRSLMLDYMDDLTAIRYLSTCSVLHAGYHEYPVKQAMLATKFTEVTELDAYFKRMRRVMIFVHLQNLFLLLFNLGFLMPRAAELVFCVIASICLVLSWSGLAWLLLTRRGDCCKRGWRGMWRKRYLMPRVQRLRTALWDLPLLPYLQHLTELTIAYDKDRPFGKKNPLPQTLRTLHLTNSPDLLLDTNTLPLRLTSLSLGTIKNKTLPVGVLPQTLMSLHLTGGFDTASTICEGALPASLLSVKADVWTQALSDLALPASLVELHIHSLSDLPLPTLPSQLQVLDIGGAFNQPLAGLLPSSLRLLKLTGVWDQPLSEVFASIPQLEELHLSDKVPYRQLAASVLPRSLRVLRLGKNHSFAISQPSDKPAELRRFIVPHMWQKQRMVALRRLGKSHGFTVTVQFTVGEITVERELEDVLQRPPANNP